MNIYDTREGARLLNPPGGPQPRYGLRKKARPLMALVARPEDPVVDEQVDAGLRNQGRQPLDELMRLEDGRARAVVPGPPELAVLHLETWKLG
jgi:hypothetical protein